MQYLLLILGFFLVSSPLFAQEHAPSLTGEWKCYLADSTTFEYLKLNDDGSGIKAVGKTINSRDTLINNENVYFELAAWKRDQNVLILEPKDLGQYFLPDSHFTIMEESESEITLFGDHLKLGFGPSSRNRFLFRRKVTYTRVEALTAPKGVNTEECLQKMELFKFTPLDKTFQNATYKGFEDLIPHLVACSYDYNFVQQYADSAYALKVPKDFDHWSVGYGTGSFDLSLLDSQNRSSGTVIVIHYDFHDRHKKSYFDQIANGEEEGKTVELNGYKIYLFKNWQGKSSGKIFLDNHLYIAYYTLEPNLEKQLQACIASFHYKR